MFEFAISQQKAHPPTPRLLAALVISIASHFLAVAILVEYPWLLGTGLRNWLRQPIFFKVSTPKEPSWRTVTFVGRNGKMDMPSSETLQKNTYDWAAHNPGVAPPIRIRWGGELADSQRATKPGAPEVKPVPGLQEPKPAPEPPGDGSTLPASIPGQSGGENPAAGGGTAGTGDSTGGKSTVYLPPPQPPTEPKVIPKKAPESVAVAAPTSIPTEKPGAASPAANLSKNPAQGKPTPPQVFENQDKAIRSEGTGFFDTKGFPLGEYASIIIERVKGNWSIPSNLRNSAGRTTVVFFIDKEGRFTDARIVNSSGSSSLDLAALNAIIGSNPFPPLPKGFPGDHVGAKFVFSYNERQ